MARHWMQLATFCLGVLALLCWVVMFLSGTDVWHDLGRPDFWNLPGPPYHDLRAFAYAFYLLLAVLFVHLIVTALDLVVARPRARKGA
jgi:hypothetical protein